jgi:hypothetical protein
MAMDRNEATLLILIDISAAFDTIDQHRLLSRMQSFMGVDGAALSWFATYLTGRSQVMKINDAMSRHVPLSFLWCPSRIVPRADPVQYLHVSSWKHSANF